MSVRRDSSHTGVAPTTGAYVQVPRPHDIERQVRRSLLSHPSLRFSSLVIRRIVDGVCLEGVLETPELFDDVTELTRKVAGVDAVLNRLLVRTEQCHR